MEFLREVHVFQPGENLRPPGSGTRISLPLTRRQCVSGRRVCFPVTLLLQ